VVNNLQGESSVWTNFLCAYIFYHVCDFINVELQQFYPVHMHGQKGDIIIVCNCINFLYQSTNRVTPQGLNYTLRFLEWCTHRSTLSCAHRTQQLPIVAEKQLQSEVRWQCVFCVN